jgi:hypothetical protein
METKLKMVQKSLVTGRETSRLPHFLDSRPTDGGKVVSLPRRPPFTLRKIINVYIYGFLGGVRGGCVVWCPAYVYYSLMRNTTPIFNVYSIA